MKFQIIWRPKARKNFQQITAYLQANWGEKEVEHFKELVKQVVNQVEINPTQFQKSQKKDIHQALITKHNLMLYRIMNDHTVELLTIFDTRQNPQNKQPI